MGYALRYAIGLNTRGSKNEMLTVLSGNRNAFHAVENVFTGLFPPTNRHTTTAPVYANICALISTRSPLPHHTLLPISQQRRRCRRHHRSFVLRAGSNNSQTADDVISSAELYRGTQNIYVYIRSHSITGTKSEYNITNTPTYTFTFIYIYIHCVYCILYT